MSGTVKTFPTYEQMSRFAAEHIATSIASSLERKKYCVLVLSGGSTPALTYEILGREMDVDWSRVHLFWGDERMVDLDHEWSNFRMARENLLTRISIPVENVHPVPVHEKDGREAARVYEGELKKCAGEKTGPGSISPDLVLLGMGSDGHTASLFPDHSRISGEELVTYVRKPGLPPRVARITLTLKAINAAEEILFLISGAEKLKLVNEIRENPGGAAQNYPAALVNPERGRVLWLVSEK